MKKLTLPSGEWLMVKVPKDAIKLRMLPSNLHVYYEMFGDKDKRTQATSLLPPGDYTLYGAEPLRLTEEEWKEIVEKIWYGNYDRWKNYQATSIREHYVFAQSFYNATESGHTLAGIYGFKEGVFIILKKQI
jgi:hypothetical protein